MFLPSFQFIVPGEMIRITETVNANALPTAGGKQNPDLSFNNSGLG
jgi:hypothetical protein